MELSIAHHEDIPEAVPIGRTSTRRGSARVRIAIIAAIVAAVAVPSVALAATLTPAPPAGARCVTSDAGTRCFWTDTAFATPGAVPYGVTCAGAPVLVSLSGERRFMYVYDEAGSLVRRVRHVTFSGTLSSAITGASVPHVGHFTVIDDYLAGTSTITGMLSRTVVPGEGVIWRNVGRIVVAMNGGTVLAEAGDHDTWAVLAGDLSASGSLCAALS